jgi:hypothetical protein
MKVTYTAKTTTVNRQGLSGLVLHQVIRANGEVLCSCPTAELAEKVACELNEFEANTPKLGDLDAEFIRTASQ